MVAKAILDIGVNAGEFEQFTRALDKYREAIESLPGTWKKVEDAAEDAAAAGAAATALPQRHPGGGGGGGSGFAPGGTSAAPGVAPTAAQQQQINQTTRSRPTSPSGTVPPNYHPTWSWSPGAFTPGVRPGAGGGGGALPPIGIPPIPGAGGTPPGGGGGAAAWSSNTVHNIVNIHQAGQRQQQAKVQQAGWAKRVQNDALAGFQAIYKTTRGIWDNVEGTAKTLLKWTGLATIFSGLLGAGGLFGIDRLGAASSAATRSATGLGTTPGNQEAFRINYARLIDPDAVLGNVSEMENDPSKRGYLQALIGANHMHDDTAQMGVLAIRAARERILRQGINNVSPQWLAANGLDSLGIDLASARRLAAPGADLNTAERGYRSDAATLNLDPATQKAWTFFSQQMTRAGQTIENDFIRGLVDLADPLSNLSKAVVTTINSFMSNPHLKGWIDDLATGIQHFGAWIQTPAFQQGVKDFVANIGQLGSILANSVAWLYAHLPASITGASNNASSLPTGAATGRGAQPAGNAGAGGPGGPGGGILGNLVGANPWTSPNSTGFDAAQAAAGFEGQGPSGVQAYLKANGVNLNAAQAAWCAAFVNASLKKVGITGSGSQIATSFENWGHAGDNLKPTAGDVLVLSRGKGPGQTGGHVGFSTGNTRMVKNAQGQMVQQDEMLAGNEGGGAGKVARNWYNASDLMDRQANAGDLPGYGSDATSGGHHNPGNLRAAPGVPTVNGFAVFANDQAGISAMAAQLGRYISRDHLTTPEEIVNRYDSGDRAAKRKAYLAAVLKDTGMTAGGTLDANNESQIDRLIAAMLRQENSVKISPAQVKLIVHNQTGGSAVVGANQAAAGS